MTWWSDPGASTQARRRRLQRIASLLACPACGAEVAVEETRCLCRGCGLAYPIRDARVYFVEPHATDDGFDDVKSRLRRMIGPRYRTIVDLVAPDFPVLRKAEVRKQFDPRRQIIIDCGSGSQRLDQNIVSVDFTEYDAVDIVCDICQRLPFADGSLDGATSWGVMEHLERPDAFVEQLARCIKPGGRTVNMVPFMYHFHSSPQDFYRYSHEGLKRLFGAFRVREVRNVSGPVSYLLLGIVEFLATLLSAGNGKLKSLVYLALCGLTFPVKILDWPFVNRKAFLGMAPCLVIVAERPEETHEGH